MSPPQAEKLQLLQVTSYKPIQSENMDTAEDIVSKMSEFTEQLRQVNGFLLSDPQNAQFLKLKEDLLKVIDLTNMINSQQHETAQSSSNDQSLRIYDDDGDDNDLENDSVDGNNEVQHRADGHEPISVGECVEVLGGDRPYAGTVTGAIDAATYQVKYFEFETEVTLPKSSLFRISPASEFQIDPEEVKIGQKGVYQCKYATDQTFYDAVVQSITPNGCIVKYTLYGNVEEVPLAYLKTLVLQVKKSQSEGTQGLIALPDNLRFLPTDTEEDKARKRKKIKAIKSKNRLFTKEAEITAVQQTWQTFVTKGTKKNSLLLPKKTSMFASSDAVDGKIGVTNSGKGMSDFAQRKKHKF